MQTVFYDDVPTPLGTMVGAATQTHLVLLEFADRPMLAKDLDRIGKRFACECGPGDSPVLHALRSQLDEFFGGTRREFDIPLRARGTAFQERVWQELLTIPVGSTTTYSAIAASIGRPTAVRAMAAANGDNPIAILIPCHRVIGSNGTLTGYGGGLWRKRRLLDLEKGAGALS